ncbi:MAG: sugar nucleotide-binding protein, partial [Desulfobulbaceae bacterium]|nr:sugar nucleotide-binding protein [Desulfobulbaceae bacterium]
MGQRKKIGVIIGGAGLIGGTLVHYFKKNAGEKVDIYAPNSKKLSLREPEDIGLYLDKWNPDFIINTAIASIDSDPQLALEVNYLG